VECHRGGLERASPFLKAMFTHDDKPLYKMGTNMFKLIHEWAYNSELPQTVTMEAVMNADYLMAEDLLERCIETFWTSAPRTELAELIEFAAMTESLVSKYVTPYMARHFDDTANWLSEFNQLPHEMVLKVLQSENFFVSSENFLWFVLKSWGKADLENRQKQLAESATYIKYLQMSAHEFYSVKEQLAQLTGDHFDADLFTILDNLHRCRAVLGTLVYPNMNWSPYQEEYELYPVPSVLKRTDLTAMEKYISPRIPEVVHFTLGGETGPSNTIQMYLHTTDSWHRVPTLTLPFNRAGHRTAVIDTNLFVVGGSDEFVSYNTVMALDLEHPHNGWRNCAPMAETRSWVSTVSVQGKLYALGGYGWNWRRFASCEVYDPATDRWTSIPEMAKKRSHAGAVAHDGKIYIAGGCDGFNILDSAEMFDPTSNTWVCLPKMKEKRVGVCCAIFEDKLYAMGGWHGTSDLASVEYLDLNDVSKGWRDAPPMNVGRSYFGAHCVRDQQGPKLIVCGGLTGLDHWAGLTWRNTTTERCEVFDGFNWNSTSNNMAKPMWGFSTASVNMTTSLRDSILDGMMQRSTTTRPQALD